MYQLFNNLISRLGFSVRPASLTEREKEFLAGLEYNEHLLAFSKQMTSSVRYTREQLLFYQEPNKLRHACVRGGFETLVKQQGKISRAVRNSLEMYEAEYRQFIDSLCQFSA